MVVVRGLVFWSAVAVTGLSISGLHAAVVAGLWVGLAGGFISGLGTKAWGRFTVARVWLAATGRLPLKANLFLEDAHRRGALRRSGATYQFRHGQVQDCLAGRPTGRRGVSVPRGGSTR